MERDDENYDLMSARRDLYIEKVANENKKSNVKMTQWELEELEIAYEEAFQVAFVLGFREGRKRAQN